MDHETIPNTTITSSCVINTFQHIDDANAIPRHIAHHQVGITIPGIILEAILIVSKFRLNIVSKTKTCSCTIAFT